MKAEKELTDYKFALDRSSIVAITDQQGIIRHVNDDFCKISKYSSEELIGQDHRIINSGYHPQSFIKNLWVTIAYGKVWRDEFCNKAKDGTIYWVDTTIVPFLNDEGKPYQYLSVQWDITEKVQYIKAIEEQNKKLHDIAWTQSHIVRAPLARMMGIVNLVKEFKMTTPEREELLTHFIDSGNELDNIIRDITEKTEPVNFNKYEIL
ncbi:MAG: PAS domain-containing protein [Sediminibacterium sp.]|nr:PAS domain-containing protein [Sediminibacterium sp.]